jgi:hypothetical protein
MMGYNLRILSPLLVLLVCSTLAVAEKAYIDNGNVRLGIDLDHGGTICFLSTGSDSESDNMVNIHDLGRYIQQSYYAGQAVDRKAEGQHKNFSPWRWNPIQAGGIGSVNKPPHANSSAEILDFQRDENFMYIKCIPRLWDMPGEAAECVFEQWMWLEGKSVRVKNKITMHRTDELWKEGIAASQELPAVYPIARLRSSYAYTGDAPWTGDILQIMPEHPKRYKKGLPPTHPDGFPWVRFKPTEPWAACVEPETGVGFGVYSPIATGHWLSGFVDHLKQDKNRDGSTANSTSYIAPLARITLNKNSSYEYEYHLFTGNLHEIRDAVYRKAGKELPKR